MYTHLHAYDRGCRGEPDIAFHLRIFLRRERSGLNPVRTLDLPSPGE